MVVVVVLLIALMGVGYLFYMDNSLDMAIIASFALTAIVNLLVQSYLPGSLGLATSLLLSTALVILLGIAKERTA